MNIITNYTYDELAKKYSIELDDNDDKDLFVSIMNGNFENVFDENTPIEGLAYYYMSVYYELIEKNYDKMKKCYSIAIEKGNINALYSIGNYYYFVEKNYDEMKKYYLMSIEKGNIHSINMIGYYYFEIEKNYDQMMKYYLMAIEKGMSIAMFNLGYYYFEIEKN